jgi:hypothetical protein
MDQGLLAGILGAGAVIAAAIIGTPRVFRKDERGGIQKDLAIYNALPPASPIRKELLLHVEERIRTAIRYSDKKRRDPGGIILAIFLIIIALFLTWQIVIWGGRWWFALPIAVFMFILGLVGFSQDATKQLRDERGRVIKE